MIFMEQDKELARVESKQILNDFIDNIPMLNTYLVSVSALMKIYYNELIKNGFTEQQAFDIIKAHGCLPPTGRD